MACLLFASIWTLADASDAREAATPKAPLRTAGKTPGSSEALTPSGRTDLFNGRDFSGWTFCMKDHADPGKTWSVTNGVIRCTGRPAGYLRTTRRYRNYRLTVQWRFVKVKAGADNTGVLVNMQLPDKVWPECVQSQGKHGHQGDIFLMGGAESKEHRGLDANTPLVKRGPSNEKPVGEWNTCELVCRDATVKVYVNGKFENETTECTISSGFIGIQSEGAEIEIRRMNLEPLDRRGLR